jgi:hypothetical protein
MRTGDYLIVATKKSQHVSFQERQDCYLMTACSIETQRNKWMCALMTVASFSLCETSTIQGHFLAVA